MLALIAVVTAVLAGRWGDEHLAFVASSEHATDVRDYTITSTGAVIGRSLGEYHGITTGVPDLADVPPAAYSGLTDEEIALLDAPAAAGRLG